MHQARLSTPVALHLLFLSVIVFGVLTAGGNWSFSHGALFTGAGLLMVVFPPVESLPRGWWLLALGFVLSMGGAFLPDAWFSPLAWRDELEAAGLETGDQVVIQRRLAWETGLVFSGTLLVGLWMLGHRVSAGGLRWVALAFAASVAGYAALCLIFQEELGTSRSQGHFGFFPNRNHTATFLAMGGLTGLGSLMQGIRERRGWMIALSLGATLVCVWAVVGWSISRAGVVLVGMGTVTWLAVLGPGYFGKHTRRALLVLGLAAGGGFLVGDFQVKQRLTETVARMESAGTGEGTASSMDLEEVDFRLPTWLDTLDMIAARPWTGFGPGQFSFVFPQYRDRSAVAGRTRHLHPESDWLWLAAEAGVPAGGLLAVLVAAVGFGSWRGLSAGRSRSIRAGCLVAALMLAFHGFFDVPGHRVPLAWSAALLLGLSLHPPAGGGRNPNRPFARIAGGVVLAGGLWLLFAQGSASREPVIIRGDRAVAEVSELYQMDLAARAEGRLPPANPANDPLGKALLILETAVRDLPLDLRLHHLEGAIALQFDASEAVVERAFAIERALDPVWPGIPLRQAVAWSSVDPRRAGELSAEIQRRAARLDAKDVRAPHGAESWSDDAQTQISTLVRKYPAMGSPAR